MKQILYIVLLIFISIANIASQENKSRFGIEVDIIPWHFDTFSRQTPFSVSGFIGGSYEHFFSNSFSFKTTIGVQNVNYQTASGYLTGGKERAWQTRLALMVEPRFYFWENQQKWGNLFAGLPVSIEAGSFQNNTYRNIFETQLIRAIPVIGYQYYFARHWFVEANAGLGWFLDRYPMQSFSEFDYQVGVRLGFSF
jgi:hypothetical protein